MTTSLDRHLLDTVTASLDPLHQSAAMHYPGEPSARQPAHTMYGGAHLFRADSAAKLGEKSWRMSSGLPIPDWLPRYINASSKS